MNRPPSISANASSRRRFLQGSVAVAGALGAARFVHAGGDDVLRVGLVGCGGRGTGAAAQAMQADKNVKLTAMADAFEDRLTSSLATLQKTPKVAAKIDVPPDRQFTGFDAYEKLIGSGVDVVLLATPPHFRPAHLKAAVDAGLHVFAEKPVAVDAPGVQSVLQSCEAARHKGLSVVSGLCLRYSQGFSETVRRIHDGAIGKVHTLQANDYRGGIWVKPRQDDWTDMHWQMRNWYYFTWLSGDFNVEQHVHYLDVCAWIMGDEYPTAAVGMGGRQVRNGEEYGNIFDHHSVVYEYESGARLFSNTRQMRGCWNNMSASAVGERGAARFSERRGGLTIANDQNWVYSGQDNNIYQTEHDRLFESIRRNEPINNGRYMALSTMMAIVGRQATYTGNRISWDEAMASDERLGPAEYRWGPLETPAVAKPGIV